MEKTFHGILNSEAEMEKYSVEFSIWRRIMKRIMWIVSCIPLIGTAIVLPFLPENIPMHYDMAGNIDRIGSKYESLIFPVLILLLTLVMHLLVKYFEKKAIAAADEKERANAKTNANVIGIVGVSMAVLYTIMHGFIVYGSYRDAISGAAKQAVDIGKVSTILMGIMFIVLGNFMTKTRTNQIVGFRLRWSMYNDTTWRKTNRFGAIAMMAAGVLTILLALIMKNSFVAAMSAIGSLLLATTATVIYAYKIYMQEKDAKEGDQ